MSYLGIGGANMKCCSISLYIIYEAKGEYFHKEWSQYTDILLKQFKKTKKFSGIGSRNMKNSLYTYSLVIQSNAYEQLIENIAWLY